jgi:hypothetical protein
MSGQSGACYDQFTIGVRMIRLLWVLNGQARDFMVKVNGNPYGQFTL